MRVAVRAVAVIATAGWLVGCERAAVEDGPVDARAAMGQWVRCAFDGVGDAPAAGSLEGAMRQALRRDRAQWVLRAGRCEDALSVRGQTPACLVGLRTRWAEMLPVVQRASDDAIETDVAVRRVGEAWSAARRGCP